VESVLKHLLPLLKPPNRPFSGPPLKPIQRITNTTTSRTPSHIYIDSVFYNES
jgi:hypothetical protein